MGKIKTIQNIVLLAISLICSFFILELGVRVISPPNIFHPILTLKPKVKMELDVNIAGISPKGVFSTNKWGMRGDEPPNDWKDYYTIVTIGGSTTQCFYLDDKKTWSYLLQDNLGKVKPKVWVGNGGLDGQTSRAHIVFMEYVVPRIKPDAVVILCGINDLTLSLDEDRRIHGYFQEKANWKRWIFAHSRLLQVLYIWKGIIFNDFFVVKTTGTKEFIPKPLNDPLTANPQDVRALAVSLDEYRKNIKEIIDIGKSLGVKMVFLTQPIIFEDTSYWKGVEGTVYWIKNNGHTLSAAAFYRMLDIFNKELIDVCRENNVLVYDLTSVIPHNDKYFYDTVHFTELGSRMVADKLAEFMFKSGLLNK